MECAMRTVVITLFAALIAVDVTVGIVLLVLLVRRP
jgi:hypothetical protein